MQLNISLRSCYSTQSSLYAFELFCNVWDLSNYCKQILHLTYKNTNRYTNRFCRQVLQCCVLLMNPEYYKCAKYSSELLGFFGFFFSPDYTGHIILLYSWCAIVSVIWRYPLKKHVNGMETEIIHYRNFALVHCWRHRVISIALQHGQCLHWTAWCCSTQSSVNAGWEGVRATPPHCPDTRVHG